ncbi:MAG: hypothetical protein ABJG78_06105 [Cyclobacteriaceae bacterium]
MKVLTVIILTFLGIQSYAQDYPRFEEILQLTDMFLEPLENFEKIEPRPNDVMEYEYAAKNVDEDIEVRYAVRPITLKEYANEEDKQYYLEKREFENTAFEGHLMVAILNLSGGRETRIENIYEFEKKRLGADWGASSFVALNSDFATDYKFCHLTVIHKKDRATYYCYFLSNNIATLIRVSRKLRASLKFR